MAELLIEVLTEELPAIPLLKNLNNMKENWKKILKEYDLESNFELFYTPRRLVLIHEDFPLKQNDKMISNYGPPLQISFNKDGTPTKAMQSFLQRNNIDDSKVTVRQKDGKEVLYYEKMVAGEDCALVLPKMLKDWLSSLNFGKSMRWGNCIDDFIRPIRNICILLDNKLVECEIFSINSSKLISFHRQARIENDSSKTQISSLSNYLELLPKYGVILNQEDRKNIILDSIKSLEKKHNVRVEIDSALLNEVIAITEHPTVILGEFEKRFLDIPKEMIITSMKENQRYFAVYKNNELYNAFVLVSNSFGGDFDLILKGNQKVLRARLKDAEFFYQNDLNLNMNFGDLSSISFMEGAGSLQDKVDREIKILQKLFSAIKDFKILESIDEEKMIQCLHLAKNDLLSQSVGEFPELQGIMGANFARKMNLDENICISISEQYLPNGLSPELPSIAFSALINIAIKLDTIFTLFNLNKIPTGSKDPFGLRRHVSSILRTCVKFNLNFSIDDICNFALDYKNINMELLKDFITERIYGIFPSINPSIVRSVLILNYGIKDSFERIEALNEYLHVSDMKSIIATFKRVANILDSNIIESFKSSNINLNDLKISLFEQSEKELYNSLMRYKNECLSDGAATILSRLQSLFKLKKELDYVFESVLIKTDNLELSTNRSILIYLVFLEFLEFGDIREISIS